MADKTVILRKTLSANIKKHREQLNLTQENWPKKPDYQPI